MRVTHGLNSCGTVSYIKLWLRRACVDVPFEDRSVQWVHYTEPWERICPPLTQCFIPRVMLRSQSVWRFSVAPPLTPPTTQSPAHEPSPDRSVKPPPKPWIWLWFIFRKLNTLYKYAHKAHFPDFCLLVCLNHISSHDSAPSFSLNIIFLQFHVSV